MEKFFFLPFRFSVYLVIFYKKCHSFFKLSSGNVGRRYVMCTYSIDNHKSKVCSYGLALSCAGLEGLKKFIKQIEKKNICHPQGSNPALQRWSSTLYHSAIWASLESYARQLVINILI